jgi:hypothetical protein
MWGRIYVHFSYCEGVRIGCGLHVGWAIEGAIGSHRKIDASYLSPHVNFTEFLESSTKQYGVALLMSEPFFRLLSPAAARYCRQVDRLRRNESEEPIGLFTYDADLTLNFAVLDKTRQKKQKVPARGISRRGTIGRPSFAVRPGNVLVLDSFPTDKNRFNRKQSYDCEFRRSRSSTSDS